MACHTDTDSGERSLDDPRVTKEAITTFGSHRQEFGTSLRDSTFGHEHATQASCSCFTEKQAASRKDWLTGMIGFIGPDVFFHNESPVACENRRFGRCAVTVCE